MIAGVPTAALYNSIQDLLIVNINYATNVTINAELIFNGQAYNEEEYLFCLLVLVIIFNMYAVPP